MIIAVLLLGALAVSVSATNTTGFSGISWQKSLGGIFGDYGFGSLQTGDGGYIVTGYSYSNDGNVTGNHGGNDFWVARLDSTGTVLWQKCLGGLFHDYGYRIAQTADGGYIVGGITNSNDGNVTGKHGLTDYWVVKLTASGTVDWQKCLGGLDNDYLNSIQQASDGGYIVAGYSYSNDGNVTGNHGGGDFWVVKLSSAGNVVWETCLGGSAYEVATHIRQTADGGYLVAGLSTSNDGDVTDNHGSCDFWVVKLDSSGSLIWQKSLGGTGADSAYHFQQVPDGGYILTGGTQSNDGNVEGNHGNYDYWVVKLDSAGNLLWQKCLGGSSDEYASGIQQTRDGGYIVTGRTQSNDGEVSDNHGNQDYWVVKLDHAGTILWQKCLGGSNADSAESIQQTEDGGYIVSGYTQSTDGDVTDNHGSADYWVVKLNPDSTADFSANPVYGTAPLNVVFSDTSLMTSIASWNWSFGDGSFSELQNPVHVYSGTGNYNVKLAITDANHYNATMEKDAFIRVNLVPGIDLFTGWNFVSTPRTLQPGFNNGSIVFGAVDCDGHTIWLYNASGAVWEHVTADTPIKPLDGIWIYSMSPAHVNLTYSTDPVGSLPRKQLFAGWNAIGFAGKSKASAWATLSSISTKWIRVMGYNSTALEFDDPMVNGETYGQYSMYRDMVPTKGYWLYVTSDTPLEAFSA